MRTALIDEHPELKDTLAELTADNKTQSEIAEAMGVKDRGTIAGWQKRPEIQIRVTRLIQEKSNRILSKTTEKIEGHLNGDKKISLENLLKIHREFAGQLLKIDTGGDAAKALEEIFLVADGDPAMAAALKELGVEIDRDEAEDDGEPLSVNPTP
jgi:hypothetical protein